MPLANGTPDLHRDEAAESIRVCVRAERQSVRRASQRRWRGHHRSCLPQQAEILQTDCLRRGPTHETISESSRAGVVRTHGAGRSAGVSFASESRHRQHDSRIPYIVFRPENEMALGRWKERRFQVLRVGIERQICKSGSHSHRPDNPAPVDDVRSVSGVICQPIVSEALWMGVNSGLLINSVHCFLRPSTQIKNRHLPLHVLFRGRTSSALNDSLSFCPPSVVSPNPTTTIVSINHQ